MSNIGVGLIGYGLGGRAFHAPYVDVTPGMTLRAVVSRDTAKCTSTCWAGRCRCSAGDTPDRGGDEVVARGGVKHAARHGEVG